MVGAVANSVDVQMLLSCISYVVTIVNPVLCITNSERQAKGISVSADADRGMHLYSDSFCIR